MKISGATLDTMESSSDIRTNHSFTQTPESNCANPTNFIPIIAYLSASFQHQHKYDQTIQTVSISRRYESAISKSSQSEIDTNEKQHWESCTYDVHNINRTVQRLTIHNFNVELQQNGLRPDQHSLHYSTIQYYIHFVSSRTVDLNSCRAVLSTSAHGVSGRKP